MKFTKGVISVQLFFKFVYVFVGLFNEKIVHNDSCFCFCSCTLWTQLNSSKTFMPWKLRHFAFKRYCCFFFIFFGFCFFAAIVSFLLAHFLQNFLFLLYYNLCYNFFCRILQTPGNFCILFSTLSLFQLNLTRKF